MILAETRYEMYDDEHLAIIKAFKTWKHYLKSSQHEVFILTDYNNFRRFIDTKSLNLRKVRWAQELSCYHFQITYHWGKANGAANALFWYLRQSVEGEEILQAKNIKIVHFQQSSLTNASLSGQRFLS